MSFAKRLLLLIVFLIGVIYSYQFYISSSEFWSISSANAYPIFDTQFISKFFFNGLLRLLFVFNLSDLQHVQLAKGIFSIIGSSLLTLIIYFFYQTIKYKNITEKSLLFLLLALFIFSPQFITNFFRVRSDTLALELFLIEYILYKKQKNTLLFCFLYPLFGVKHIMYSVICLCFNVDRIKLLFFATKKLSIVKKVNLTLILVAVSLMIFNLYSHEFFYWLRNYLEPNTGSAFLYRWLKQEWPLLLLSFSFIIYSFQPKKLELSLSLVFLFMVLFVITSPFQQPYFLNLFIFPFYFFTLIEFSTAYQHENGSSRIFVLAILLVINNYFYQTNKYHWFSPNRNQFNSISSLSEFVNENKLTHLDGMGILPRSKQIYCFISPGDERSNENCRNLIKNHSPDLIIFTQRLLSEARQTIEILGEDKTYFEIFPGLASKKKCEELKCNSNLQDIKPFSTFAFEFN